MLVVLDEAYIEYAEGSDLPDGLDFLAAYPNLLVSRTFSKAYGLAALRVGYGLSTAVVADVLNRVRQPFNVNSLALAAACAALQDAEYLAESRRLNETGMQQLEAGFRDLGLSWIPSKGNFICVDLGRVAAPVFQGLLREGVIVRPVANYGMPNHLRITIGLPAETAASSRRWPRFWLVVDVTALPSAEPVIGRLVVVGLGLIGGSFAKGLRESGLCREVVGVDLDPQSRKLAVELGVVDRCEDDLALACQGADVIQLAVPILAMEKLLGLDGGYGLGQAILTDVGSAKGNVVRAAQL